MMFQMIIESGIPSQNIHVLGKIYSTSFEVLAEFQKLGIDADQPDFDLRKSFD